MRLSETGTGRLSVPSAALFSRWRQFRGRVAALAVLAVLGVVAPTPAAADTAPTISSVTINSTPSFDADGDNTADTYVRRDKIVVDVRFSEAVTVSGGNNNVRLRLDLGADDTNLANSRKVIKLKSVVGGDTLRFEHRVTASDSDPDGMWVQTVSATNAQTVFAVGGAAVTSTATGVAAVLTKTGLATSGAATHKVDGSRTQAPAAANRAPTFPADAPTTFEVAENTPRRTLVGTVTATDPDGDALTYALDSASRSVFRIDSTGAITVKYPNALDHETKASYAVTVSVRDGKDALGQPDTAVDATHSLTVSVTDVLVEAVTYIHMVPGGGSSTSVKLAWVLPTQPAGVTVSAVEVQVLLGHSTPWRTVASLAPVANTEGLHGYPSGTKVMEHEVIGLTPGVVNHIRIRLVTNSGNADSTSLIMSKAKLPTPVTDLSVSNVTRTSVDLSWTMPRITDSSPFTRALNVQQRGANGSWTTVATITPDEQPPTTFPPVPEDPHYSWSHRVATLYTVTGLTAGTSYTFRIRLVPNSSADSVDSETASTTTLGRSLNPVGGLTASNSTATTIDLAWALPTQPAGVTVTGLEVQRQSDDAWTTVASLGTDATSHTVTDLTEGTTYTFRVRLAANNRTADSETVLATALASPKPATDLAASNPSRTGIDLSWTLPAQSLGVTVSAVELQYRYATSKGLGYNDWAWGTLVTLAADATSHTVTQVTPGTNYAFRIRLATNNGHADSESVAAAALEPPKPATGLSISNVTGTTVDLSWTFPAQPEGVVVTAVEVHSGGLIKPGDESVPDFKAYGQVELAGDATSIALPVLHGGFTHRFRVRLVTNSGEVDSEVVSWSSTRPYPKDATDLTASNATQTTVDLTWTLPEQAGVTVSAVEVVWDLADGVYRYPWNEETLAADATSHTMTGLKAGTAYDIFIRLVTSSGSPSSDRLTVTTQSGAVSAPGMSVADASAEEGADAAVEFEVTLSQAASGAVTVDYATEDLSARAGQDYTATSGTLTFAAGELRKTVSVPILDDAIDEGKERFRLRLSDVEGAWIADGLAFGTITNSDPLQKMWLSRFGRTVAGHVTDAVSDRLSGPLTGAQVTVGGQAVDLTATEDEALLGETMTSVARALGAADGPEPGSDGWSGADGGEFRSLGSSPVRTMSGRELLLGSSFHLAREGEGSGPGIAAWGRVAVGGFDGEAPADAGSVRIDGDVTTGVLGADASWDRLLAGVAVSLSEGEGAFDQPGVDSGTIESTMTVVSPYGRVNLSERVSAWGLVGFGTGDMTIVQESNDRGQPERVSRTDLGMRLAAVGGRGALLEADETGGMDLALKTDAFFVETESEAISNEGSTTADASRVRLALEGGRAFAFGGGATLRPSLELGLRHDGGDAETGMGVEVGGGVSYADAASGLSIEANARMLVSHADSDYEEWGASASVRLAPGERGRGLSFSLSPTVGVAASAEERLWGAQRPDDFAPITGEFAASRGLDAELGYGLSLFGDRFTGTPNVGFALSDSARDYRIGWRLTSAIKSDLGFEVNLDATRREATAGKEPPEHGVMLRGAIRW